MDRRAVPLREAHLCRLAELDYSVGLNLRSPDDRNILLRGEGFAALDDEKVFAAAGVVPLWKGCGMGWAVVPALQTKERMFWFSKQARSYMDRLTRFRRVQTSVPADYHVGIAWAKFLGFEPEGRMKAYDEKGQDHIMFARIYG